MCRHTIRSCLSGLYQVVCRSVQGRETTSNKQEEAKKECSYGDKSN